MRFDCIKVAALPATWQIKLKHTAFASHDDRARSALHVNSTSFWSSMHKRGQSEPACPQKHAYHQQGKVTKETRLRKTWHMTYTAFRTPQNENLKVYTQGWVPNWLNSLQWGQKCKDDISQTNRSTLINATIKASPNRKHVVISFEAKT